MLATNPMRISFRGKELVFARYNYFKKIKKNHLAKFEAQQDKQREQERKESQQQSGVSDYQDTPDSFRVAKTILH
jgi:hypothetical protein